MAASSETLKSDAKASKVTDFLVSDERVREELIPSIEK
jgi:hypothetical protein